MDLMTADEAASYRAVLINRGVIVSADKMENSTSKGKITRKENLQNKKNEIPATRLALANDEQIKMNVLLTVGSERVE